MIPLEISDNIQTKHIFELESDVDKTAGENLIIQCQNIIDYLRFFIGYPGFWENQTYQPSGIYN